jgi:hypothetical protein
MNEFVCDPETACTFLKTVVVFRIVAAGNDREALLRFADRLCAELGCREGEIETPEAPAPLSGDGGWTPGMLSAEDESLAVAIRRSLERIAAAVGGREGSSMRGVAVALNGAELVIRGELLTGNAARLPGLIPSFVFLVTLPIVEHDEALDLSRRASELIEEPNDQPSKRGGAPWSPQA